MEEMKQWIEHHKRILQKAAGALLAFVVGACLVFMIHPVKTLPKDRLLSLSRMQEASQQFVAPSSKEPALEDLLSLELARGEGKVQKSWVTLSDRYPAKKRFTNRKCKFTLKINSNAIFFGAG